MASLTRWLVASLIRGLLFRTRDTVDWETPASRAMSQLLGLRLGSSLAIGRLLIAFQDDPQTLVVFGQFKTHGHAGRAFDAVPPSCDAAVSVQVQTCA